MVRYVHQGFLMECPCRDMDAEAFRLRGPPPAELRDWKEERDLFDGRGPVVRGASLSEWEGRIAVREDMDEVLGRMRDVDRLVLIDDRPRSDDDIRRAFAFRHLKAFLWLCHEAGFACEWMEGKETDSLFPPVRKQDR